MLRNSVCVFNEFRSAKKQTCFAVQLSRLSHFMSGLPSIKTVGKRLAGGMDQIQESEYSVK